MAKPDFSSRGTAVDQVAAVQPAAPETGKRKKPDFSDRGVIAPPDRTTGEEFAHDVNATGTALWKGIANVLGLPGDINQFLALENAKPPPTDFRNPYMAHPAPSRDFLTSQRAKDYLFNENNPPQAPFGWNPNIPKVEPDTQLGKIAEAGVEMIPSALLAPGSAAKALIPLIASGAASETAGQLTKGTAFETPARLAAGVLTPGVLGFRGMMRGTPGGILAKQTANMKPEDWAIAQELEAKGRDTGVKLMGPEAIGNQGLLTLQRQVERGGGEGGAIMERAMRDRPGQVRRAGEAANLTIGPKVEDVPTTTTKIGQAATDVIKRAETERSAAVRPFYKAAAGDVVSEQHMKPILDAIDTEIAASGSDDILARLQALRNDLVRKAAVPAVPPTLTVPGSPRRAFVPATPGSPAVPEIPETRVGALDSIRKAWREKMELPDISGKAPLKEEAARIDPVLSQLRDSMTRSSPDFAYGRALYEKLSETHVKPLIEGAPGQMQKAKTTAAQIAMIADPKTARPATITDVVTRLQRENPEAARDLVRLHLENTFDQASKAVVTGPNQMGGAKFAVALAGSPQRQANIEAAIRALPNGDRLWQGYNTMLQVFEATGRRIPVGSMTSENIAAREALKEGGIAGAIKTGAGPLRAIRDWAEGLRYGKNTVALAKIFTSPESVAEIRKLAFLAPGSARAQALVLSILGGVQANQQGDQPPATMAPAP